MAVAVLRYVSDYGTPPAEKEVTLVSGKYTFTSDDLPVMTCDGYSFAGWFFDGEYIEPGDELHADDGEVIELDAGWGAAVMPLDDTGETTAEEGGSGMEVQYLGKAGITHYHERVKGYVEEEIDAHAVKYDAAQGLTDAQKTQSRENIGAASVEYVDEHDMLMFEMTYDSETQEYVINTTFDELMSYFNQGRKIFIFGNVKSISGKYMWSLTTGSSTALWFSSIKDFKNTMIQITNNSIMVYSNTFVQTSRTINGKALSGNITLDAEDVGAVPVPETTFVGDVMKVSAVDENGIPTAWEATSKLEGIEEGATATSIVIKTWTSADMNDGGGHVT